MAIVNIYFIAFFLCITYPINSSVSSVISKSPNVIIILADDLGYGDLGFEPFNSPEMQFLQTPSLKKMAENGLSMSNFHVAAPVCSPSRASILVGLFPWRMGVDFIYAGDLKNDGSIELDNEQLPLLPNIAMSFRAAGYYCAHMGKWHLGGQSQYDIPNRNNGNCSAPGINQYGFDEYVGMDEGTGSSRYWTHQRAETYHTGSNYLFKNDIPLPPPTKPEILTDRQTDEAMRVIQEQVAAKQPFFLNLWYDAPHSPWELIEPFQSQYQGKYEGRTLKYVTMIANMDYNIGRLLSLLDTLHIAENTIVVFTSDNGPENGAGNAGPRFIGRKRLLTEGGIRVPAIWQWKGHIRAGTTTDKFGIGTDLFPTLLDLAGISCPPSVRLDGVSLSPLLLHPTSSLTLHGDERLLLWYSHSVGYPKFTAAWSHGFKLLWADYEDRPRTQLPPAWRLFDMRTPSQHYESTNILATLDFQDACRTLSTKGSRRLLGTSGAEGGAGVTWRQIASINRASPTSKDMLALVQLVAYLQLKMHLFRYEGDVDWRQSYYRNKPCLSYEHSCQTRNASAAVFPWSLPPLVPAFCGAAMFAEMRGGSCHCSLHKCPEAWRSLSSEGWTKGYLFRNSSSSRHHHRNLRVSVSAGASTVELERQLDLIMANSAFSPLCQIPQLPTATTAAVATGNDHNSIIVSLAKTVGMSVKSVNAQRRPHTQRWTDLLLAHTDDTRYDTLLNAAGTNLQTSSFINEKWKKYRVTGRTCFPDFPVTSLSSGAFACIPLCLSSWNMLQGKRSAGGGGSGSGGTVNVGALMYGLHLTLHQHHKKVGGDRKPRIALLDPMHLPPPLTLLPTKTSAANTSTDYYTDSIRILASRIFDATSSSSRNGVDMLVLPLPISSAAAASTTTKGGVSSKGIRAKKSIGAWSLAVLSGLNGGRSPALTVIYPPSPTATASLSSRSALPATAVVTADKSGGSNKPLNKTTGAAIKAADFRSIEWTTAFAFRSVCWLCQSATTAPDETSGGKAHRLSIDCDKRNDLSSELSVYEYFMSGSNGYRDSGSFTMKLFDTLLNSDLARHANNIPEGISGILENADFSEKSVDLFLLNFKTVIKNAILEQDISHRKYLRSMSGQIKKTS